MQQRRRRRRRWRGTPSCLLTSSALSQPTLIICEQDLLTLLMWANAAREQKKNGLWLRRRDFHLNVVWANFAGRRSEGLEVTHEGGERGLFLNNAPGEDHVTRSVQSVHQHSRLSLQPPCWAEWSRSGHVQKITGFNYKAFSPNWKCS